MASHEEDLRTIKRNEFRAQMRSIVEFCLDNDLGVGMPKSLLNEVIAQVAMAKVGGIVQEIPELAPERQPVEV